MKPCFFCVRAALCTTQLLLCYSCVLGGSFYQLALPVCVCVFLYTCSASFFFLQFRFSHRGNLHAAHHLVMAASAGRALSGGILGRPQSAQVTTGSSSQQNPAH